LAEYAVPAAYCGDAQLPPTTEELLLATELEMTDETLDETLLDDAGTELDDVAPSQLPSKSHSCHWPE
jgi:hypothetical protein